jgi:hypothetical protein
MSPDTRREGTLAVVVLIQAFFKEFLSKNIGLQEAVHLFFEF